MSRLVISSLPGELRMARLQGGRLADLWIEREASPYRLGNLYRARIAKLDRNLKAAFCDIGAEDQAFLPLPPDARLSEGDYLVIRILREASEGKGPKAALHKGRLPAGLGGEGGPSLLLRGGDPVLLLLEAAEPEEILLDDPAFLQRLRRLLAEARPEIAGTLKLYKGTRPLFEAEGLEAPLEALLQPEVALSGGGRLWIEPTRACVAIDVDSGGRKNALQVNLEAAREIARQLRLRALSGLIVADFLELAGKAERKRFDAGLQEAFSGDPEPHQLQPLRASGLLEMTRRRSRPALHEILTEPCGLGGGGRRATALTDAFRALRALQAAALEGPGGRPGLRLAPRVEQALQGEAAAALAALAGRLGYDPVLQQANGLADFEVVTEPRR